MFGPEKGFAQQKDECILCAACQSYARMLLQNSDFQPAGSSFWLPLRTCACANGDWFGAEVSAAKSFTGGCRRQGWLVRKLTGHGGEEET